MEFREFKGKTLEEAVTNASIGLGVTSDELEYKVIDEGNAGILGFINKKPCIIEARVKLNLVDRVREFMNEMFHAMNMEVEISIEYNEEKKFMDIELSGNEMGILIGKRGQTLDALQHLVSLYANRGSDTFIKVKMDTENYRKRRKEALENLATNIAFKVKRYKKTVTLEPMVPYERRIIHTVLQNDRYVATKSEGEEPNRRVVIYLKK